ncbi:MAG: hypothetical protein OXF24_03145 [Hyphomicrobiales bacterium]|nr:hypothetical protein [Hyphomicrobiales bacterium]MCY4048564.1 hypothetical protein [Hyphomicrobiales bacterium]MCY4053271.1 hypothetical protein [Hyphomicrobiales bacterium]
MKTILTTIFVIAVMVFTFNTNLVIAIEGKTPTCVQRNANGDCTKTRWVENEVDRLNDPDQAGNENEVADSSGEGAASAAQESDQ